MFYMPAAGDDYEAWLGVKSLPKLNWASSLLRERFDGIAGRWLRQPYGLDGWRVDVANMTGRHRAADHTIEVARFLRGAVVQARADALLVAEHGHDASADLDRDGWQGTMNYAGFMRPLWTWLRADDLPLDHFFGVPGPVPRRGGPAVVASMRAFGALISWRSLTHGWNLLGSHDTARLATVIGDRGRIEVAVGLLATLPGVPMVFAGDEAGITGVNGEDSRRPMPWDSYDRWDQGRHRSLLGLRRRHPALVAGGLRWAHVDDDTLCFLRETPSERLLVLARRSAGASTNVAGVGAAAAENIYGGATAACAPDGSVTLPGDGPTFQMWRLA
jgi:alpha-glucosidase